MEFKPCPFCGEKHALEIIANHYEDYAVQCANCGVEGPPCSISRHAIYEWNKRKGGDEDARFRLACIIIK